MNYLLLVLGMAVVTYVPRMIPMVILSKVKLPPFWKRLLEFIPIAVLSALIFPGILFSTRTITSAVIGGMIAIILALIDINLLLVVIGGILGVFCWEILL